MTVETPSVDVLRKSSRPESEATSRSTSWVMMASTSAGLAPG